METAEREARRKAFDAAASEYDRVRPGYPAAVIDTVMRLSGLEPGARVLEIGCGTGQATKALAARGLTVVALEPSGALARVAAERLAAWEHVFVREETFEAFRDSIPYDAVVAATSFHWLDPDIRLRKAHGHLRQAGWLILLGNTHPRPYAGFFQRADAVYARVAPEWYARRRSRSVDMVAETVTEISTSAQFRVVTHETHDWQRRYTRDEYLMLLRTQSDHRLLETRQLQRLLDELSTVIDSAFAGSVVRPYRTVMALAQKC